jgi:hypothetical protein
LATVFFYIGITAAVAAMAVLGFGVSQLSQQRNALSRGQYFLFISLCLVGIASFFLFAWLD